MDFWRKIAASVKLGFLTQVEYRLNAFIDWCLNPLLTSLVELLIASRLFEAMNVETLGGFQKASYMSYMSWAVFFSRAAANWNYEYRMVNEVESGNVNAILVRPMSFYEFYLGQFLGYKLGTITFSFWIPILISLLYQGTTDFGRLGLSLLLLSTYLLFSHTLSFLVCTLAFRFTKVSSFTVTKNILIWVASGELFPMDLLPLSLQSFVGFLPFTSACYLPVGYLTQRVGLSALMSGFYVTIFWTLVVGAVAAISWRRGLYSYAGTGA